MNHEGLRFGLALFAGLSVWLGLGLAVPGEAAAQAAQAGTTGSQLAAASAARAETAAEPFWEALRLDDVKRLQTQMLRGAGANAVHPEFGPAIVVAARERSPKVLAYLARLSGTRVDATNANNETALMLVALQGDLDSVKLLVERGAQVNRHGWAPLHYAASAGHLPTLQFLLDQDAYIDAESPNRTTPLMMAARQKHTNAVQFLVDAGADPTLRNEAGYTAADYLAAHGEHAEARRLSERASEFARKYRVPAEGARSTVERGTDSKRDGSATSPPMSTTNAPMPTTNAAKAGTSPTEATNPAGVTTSPVAPRPRLPGSRD